MTGALAGERPATPDRGPALAPASCNLLAAVANCPPGTPRGMQHSQGARPISLPRGIKCDGPAARPVAAPWRACVAYSVVLSRGADYCTDFLVPSGQHFVELSCRVAAP